MTGIGRSHLADPHSLAVGARFFARVPAFLRHPLSLEAAREIQRERMRNREQNFLDLARSGIYAHPERPVHRLLAAAGCEYGDLERLVSKDGIEKTLQTLLEKGVYVTVDEFKGRKDIVRGSLRISSTPEQLENPLARSHVAARSGGSRSAGTPLLFDLAFVRACGVVAALHLDARGGRSWVKATWETPGAGARFRLLKFASVGLPPVAWFTQVDPRAPGLDPVFRWSDRALRAGGALARVPMPRPTLATLEDPLPVAEWMRTTLAAGDVPFMLGFPSSVVRLCVAAEQAGIDIAGARCILGGEPITQARLDRVRAGGLDALPRYGSMECGPIGYGCLQPAAPDDVHVVADLQVVIQAGDSGSAVGVPSRSLFVSSLHAAAPFLMLNFSMGDLATLEERPCGCPLEALGWRTHLHTIRSFEKLTVGGVTFHDTDLMTILERVLPKRFGGAPTDYQLVEAEAEDGQARLSLVVHPSVGELNDSDVLRVFLEEISGDRAIDAVMASMLGQGGTMSVDRRPPSTTSAGKVLHLHVDPR